MGQELQLRLRVPVRFQRACRPMAIARAWWECISPRVTFGDVSLDGLSFVATVDFPGPLHEGNGTLQAIIEERAAPAQRDALFAILSGQNSAEGTIFHIFSVIVTKMLDPIFAPIHFEFDLPGRRAKVSIPGVLETENEPIRNPVTGASHRIQVVMPEGFEHHSAEVCSARISSTGGIRFEVAQGHGSLATVVQTPKGWRPDR